MPLQSWVNGWVKVNNQHVIFANRDAGGREVDDNNEVSAAGGTAPASSSVGRISGTSSEVADVSMQETSSGWGEGSSTNPKPRGVYVENHQHAPVVGGGRTIIEQRGHPSSRDGIHMWDDTTPRSSGPLPPPPQLATGNGSQHHLVGGGPMTPLTASTKPKPSSRLRPKGMSSKTVSTVETAEASLSSAHYAENVSGSSSVGPVPSLSSSASLSTATTSRGGFFGSSSRSSKPKSTVRHPKTKTRESDLLKLAKAVEKHTGSYSSGGFGGLSSGKNSKAAGSALIGEHTDHSSITVKRGGSCGALASASSASSMGDSVKSQGKNESTVVGPVGDNMKAKKTSPLTQAIKSPPADASTDESYHHSEPTVSGNDEHSATHSSISKDTPHTHTSSPQQHKAIVENTNGVSPIPGFSTGFNKAKTLSSQNSVVSDATGSTISSLGGDEYHYRKPRSSARRRKRSQGGGASSTTMMMMAHQHHHQPMVQLHHRKHPQQQQPPHVANFANNGTPLPLMYHQQELVHHYTYTPHVSPPPFASMLPSSNEFLHGATGVASNLPPGPASQARYTPGADADDVTSGTQSLQSVTECMHCVEMERHLLTMQSDLEYLRNLAQKNEFVCAECEGRQSQQRKEKDQKSDAKDRHSHSSGKNDSRQQETHEQHQSRKKRAATGVLQRFDSGKSEESAALTEASQRLVEVTERHKKQIEHMTKETARWQSEMQAKMSALTLTCQELKTESTKRKEEATTVRSELTVIQSERNAFATEVDVLQAKLGVYERQEEENKKIRELFRSEEMDSLDRVDEAIVNRDNLIADLTVRLQKALDALEVEREQHRQRRQIIFPGSEDGNRRLPQDNTSTSDGNNAEDGGRHSKPDSFAKDIRFAEQKMQGANLENS